jgi:Tat protein translocase TatC
MAGLLGEMPFLDHLEELRRRVFRVLGALVIGTGIGLWLVQALNLISFLKQPIEPYLPDGKLTVLSPTEPIMILLKLALAVGLVLASPIIIYQIWAFLSPALYEREKKAIVPSLFAGMLLFIGGAIGGYLVVVPPALRFLLNIEPEALQTLITFNFYFSFIIQISLAMGLAFELPLILMLLTWLGVVTPMLLSRYRQYAVVLSLVAAAFLTPADVTSMIILGVSLVFLYEVGVVGSKIIYRRRLKRAARSGTAVIIFLLAGLGTLEAQELERPEKAQQTQDTVVRTATPGDSLRRSPQVMDTAMANRMGLPTSPSRQFRAPDAFMASLLNRTGYQVTRYQADTATLFMDTRHIQLTHEALTERQGATLEADSISFREMECLLDATGDPRLFDGSQVLVGESVSYNTCTRRGVVNDALTNFQQMGAVWFLRGNVAQDSSSSRIYSSSSEVTSCDVPDAHYHFSSKKMKWVNQSMFIARPAVLYVRDVPIMWLPFVFQDISPGRRSGILIPQFGFNDIVRPNESYGRQITNVGYYWAPNDYVDVTARLDWYSGRYTNLSLNGRYRWRDRQFTGSLGVGQTWENTGANSMGVRWSHVQDFNLTTRVNLDLNYESNTRVINTNAVDPRVNTQQISSSLNFTKTYPWGSLALGGTRRQSVTDRSVSTRFPSLTLSPKPFDFGRSMTWSPTLSIVNTQNSTGEATDLPVAIGPGIIDTIGLSTSDRTTTIAFGTPLRIGGFNWQNSIQVVDRKDERRIVASTVVPNPGNPADSLQLQTVSSGLFSTSLDWQTGISLPLVARRSWRLQPTVSVVNTTGGPFLLRNEQTNGQFVRQGKRLEFRLSSTPTFFAFFPGFAGTSRIRHSFSPLISYSLAPGADVPQDYADAITPPGGTPVLRSDPQHRLSVGLTQNFEGKSHPAEGDTLGTSTTKFRILGWQISPVTYDFEQANKPGRTGWATQTLTNTFQTDLIPNFSTNITHDLWQGVVGTDSAEFDPFLLSASANFGLTGRTVQSFLSLFGLASDPGAPDLSKSQMVDYRDERGFGRTSYNSPDALRGGGKPFTAAFNYTLTRSRPILGVERPTRQNLGFRTSFSPTAFWTVSWNTQYNIADSRFESQVLRLERDLHKWRARFEFIRNPNGNFAFYFSVFLTSLPDIKIDYDQSTITR